MASRCAQQLPWPSSWQPAHGIWVIWTINLEELRNTHWNLYFYILRLNLQADELEDGLTRWLMDWQPSPMFHVVHQQLSFHGTAKNTSGSHGARERTPNWLRWANSELSFPTVWFIGTPWSFWDIIEVTVGTGESHAESGCQCCVHASVDTGVG